MVIHKTEDFISEFGKLQPEVKKLYRKQETIFKISWIDPRLHTKIVKELKGVYSFRVTRRYRVLFYFRAKEAIFFSIGHRRDVY